MSQFSITNSIIVHAPLDLVFEKFTDPYVQTEWMTAASKRRHYSPPLAVGKEWESVTEFMGREMVTKYAVDKIDAPNQVSLVLDGSAMTGEFQQSCALVAEGVKVTITFNGEISGFLVGLAAPLLMRQVNKRMQGDLESFKQFIED